MITELIKQWLPGPLRRLIRHVRYQIASGSHARGLRWSYGLNRARLAWLRASRRWLHGGRRIVAIARIEHFGDIVACEPVSRYIRQKYPDAYILWFIRRPYRELVATNPHIDRIIGVHCLTEWIWLSQSSMFDVLVDLHIPGRVCPKCRIPLVKEGGSHGITLENYYAHGALLPVFSRCAGLPPLQDQPALYIPENTRQKVAPLLPSGRFVAIHCSSNEEARDWQNARWRMLIGHILQMTDVSVVEVGLQPVLEGAVTDEPHSARYVNLCGRLSFLETAEVIRRACLFIGVDSGPAHLANAVQAPGIILLGRYRAFARYMPYTGAYAEGVRSVVLHADGPVADLPVEEVWGLASAFLGGSVVVRKREEAPVRERLRGE